MKQTENKIIYPELDNSRHQDIINPNEIIEHVNVIGVGGIGSPTVMCLSKMGCDNISVWDDDTVELHNIATQFYRIQKDIEVPKVDAIANIVESFNGTTVKTNNLQVGGEEADELYGVVVSGVDSIEARIEIWKGLKNNINVPVYIDARMGAEVCRIFTIDPSSPQHIERYERSINPNKERVELPCTAKAIIYNTFGIAGLIANQVKKFFKGEHLHNEIIFDYRTIDIMKRDW
jgi:molybdopterin/thiamine biosynthesis adenylyltransferase